MPLKTASKLLDYARAWPIGALGAALLLFALLSDLARVDLLLWGVTKIAVLAYLGYWIDRLIFPYARPHEYWWPCTVEDLRAVPVPLEPDKALPIMQAVVTSAPQIRRAIIMAACILGALLIP